MMYCIQVTLEESPSESFTNTSAQKCWEMVMSRLKPEFAKRQSAETAFSPVPNLQKINGLAMFGFLTPHIMQVITVLIYLSIRIVGKDLELEVLCRLYYVREVYYNLSCSWVRPTCRGSFYGNSLLMSSVKAAYIMPSSHPALRAG